MRQHAFKGFQFRFAFYTEHKKWQNGPWVNWDINNVYSLSDLNLDGELYKFQVQAKRGSTIWVVHDIFLEYDKSEFKYKRAASAPMGGVGKFLGKIYGFKVVTRGNVIFDLTFDEILREIEIRSIGNGNNFSKST